MLEIEATWALVGKIGAVLAAIVGIVKSVQYLYGLTPSSKLDNRLTKIEQNQSKDFEHLKKVDEQIESLRKKTDETQSQLRELNEGIQRLGRSQISLLRHMIDGNGLDKMKEEADDLTQFFISR